MDVISPTQFTVWIIHKLVCVCVCYCRVLHIAVVQEKVAVVHRLIHILHQAHKTLDLYNNLRQVWLYALRHAHKTITNVITPTDNIAPWVCSRNARRIRWFLVSCHSQTQYHLTSVFQWTPLWAQCMQYTSHSLIGNCISYFPHCTHITVQWRVPKFHILLSLALLLSQILIKAAFPPFSS